MISPMEKISSAGLLLGGSNQQCRNSQYCITQDEKLTHLQQSYPGHKWQHQPFVSQPAALHCMQRVRLIASHPPLCEQMPFTTARSNVEITLVSYLVLLLLLLLLVDQLEVFELLPHCLLTKHKACTVMQTWTVIYPRWVKLVSVNFITTLFLRG